MQLIDITFGLLILSTLLIIAFMRYTLHFKPRTQIHSLFICVLVSALILCTRINYSKSSLFSL